MKRTRHILSAITALAAITTACNTTGNDLDVETSKSTQVTAFYIKSNPKVMDNLDSVFFSIDLVKGEIFNADSMPCGTNVSRLVPSITTAGASVAELHVPRPGQTDTIHNYLKNPGDSIDFSNGPVKLRIVSPSGETERTYTIRVNVHRVKADSLEWTRAGTLPGAVSTTARQRTVAFAGQYWTLCDNGGDITLSHSTVPGQTVETAAFKPGFTPDINSLTAAGDKVYMLDTDGRLHWTADLAAAQWETTEHTWHSIAAAYMDGVVGTRKVDGQWYLVNYPCGIATEMPDGFPVDGMSQSIEYSFKMGMRPISLIVGGRTAEGRLTPACWGYDGIDWVRLSARELPKGIEGAVVLPYYTTRTKADWLTSRYATIVLMGGRLGDGTLNTDVYQSPDYGYSWSKAAVSMQLPKDVSLGYGAQGFVVPRTLTVGQRIIKPVTEWECPYIFVFGGNDANGSLMNQLWQAVITRFTFKPVE